MSKRTITQLKGILIFVALVILAYPGLTWASADSDAQQDFKQIVEEIRSKGRSMQPPQLIIFAEKRLLNFIEKYPDSPEAVQARMGMGQIYSSVGENEKAIAQLELLFKEDVTLSKDERGGARWLLAKAYLENQDFDKSEGLLQKIVEETDKSDTKLLLAVQNELERIEALKKLTIGSPASDFPETTKGISGDKISLKDFKGKVVLIDFWATWCMPCKMEMPNVISVYNKYHKDGFEIIAISLDKDIESLKAYVKENDIRWEQIFVGDWTGPLTRIYAVQSIPSTFLLGRDGRIREKNLRGEALEETVKKLVKEK
jgi:thiol-disulfide isomerase/thioredoxin